MTSIKSDTTFAGMSNHSAMDTFKPSAPTDSGSNINVEELTPTFKGTSNVETLYHIVCIVLGMAILQISQAFSQTGWLGVPCLFFSAFVVDYAGKKLVQCLYVDGKRIVGGYPEIGRLAYGPVAEYIVHFFFNIVLLGTTCLYLILSGENLAELFPVVSKQNWILICAAVLYIPFLFMRTLKEVALMSLFGMFASTLVAVVVWVLGLMDIGKYNPDNHTIINLVDFPKGFGTFSVSLNAIFLYPEIEHSMATPKAFPKIASLSMILIVFIYALTGIIGYTVYGNTVQSPIFDNLPKGVVTDIARVIITAHVLLACPLLNTAFANRYEHWLQLDANKDTIKQWSLRAVLRTCIIIVVTTIAFFLPYFMELLTLMGSAADTLLIYVFPLFFYYKIHGYRGRSILELGFAVFLMILGLVLGFMGGYDAILDLVAAVKKDMGK